MFCCTGVPQSRPKSPRIVLLVVDGQLLASRREHGEGRQGVALGLDATQHLPCESAAESVGLDEDE